MTASSTRETGEETLTALTSEVAVVFEVEKTSASYRFTELQIINTTDPDPARITVASVIAKTVSGFTVRLSGETDSANYVFAWGVKV